VKQPVIPHEIARKLVNGTCDLVTLPVSLRPIGLRTRAPDDPFARVTERSEQSLLIVEAEMGTKWAADHSRDGHNYPSPSEDCENSNHGYGT
jgi:hypothetical protein